MNKDNQFLLDICILTAGRYDLLDKCLEHIIPEMRPEYSLNVFNNGYPSPQYTEIYKKYPQARTKQANQNIGFPGGANTAIRMGKAPLALFISDDIFIRPGTIDTLIRRMDDSTIALCGLKLLFPEGSTDPTRPAGKVQHVGHAINIRGEVVHPLMAWSAENHDVVFLGR